MLNAKQSAKSNLCSSRSVFSNKDRVFSSTRSVLRDAILAVRDISEPKSRVGRKTTTVRILLLLLVCVCVLFFFWFHVFGQAIETTTHLESIEGELFKIIETDFEVGNFLVEVDLAAWSSFWKAAVDNSPRGFDDVHGTRREQVGGKLCVIVLRKRLTSSNKIPRQHPNPAEKTHRFDMTQPPLLARTLTSGTMTCHNIAKRTTSVRRK